MIKAMTAALLVLSCVLPAAASDPPVDPDRIAAALARIQDSLDRLIQILDEDRTVRRADFLLRRIERREARLAALESRLRSARSRKANDEEQLAQVEMYRASMEDEIRGARERGDPQAEGQIETMILQTDMEEKRLKDRIESTAARILELEDDLAAGREAIEDLDLRLEEMLALMDESD